MQLLKLERDVGGKVASLQDAQLCASVINSTIWICLLLGCFSCHLLVPPSFPPPPACQPLFPYQGNGFSWVARCESRPHVAIWIFVYVKWKFMAHTLITDWWIRECRCCCEPNTLPTSLPLSLSLCPLPHSHVLMVGSPCGPCGGNVYATGAAKNK